MTVPRQLIQQLKAAKWVVVLTGAGVSAESGVPTFRDAQTGLWAKFSPEELATPCAFQRNPRLVWEWYEWRRKLVAEAKPNPAHLALAEMEKLFPQFHLITQNVDGLHQRAGSRNVIELHGNILRTKCFDEGTIISAWKDTGDVPPKCPDCGGLAAAGRGLVRGSDARGGNGAGVPAERRLRSLPFHRHVGRCASGSRVTIRSVDRRGDSGGNQPAADAVDGKGGLCPGRHGRKNSAGVVERIPDLDL